MRCPPSAIPSRKGIARYAGVSRSGPLRWCSYSTVREWTHAAVIVSRCSPDLLPFECSERTPASAIRFSECRGCETQGEWKKGVLWKRGRFRKVHFLEILETPRLWKTKENQTILSSEKTPFVMTLFSVPDETQGKLNMHQIVVTILCRLCPLSPHSGPFPEPEKPLWEVECTNPRACLALAEKPLSLYI